MDIEKDPYIIRLKADLETRASDQLRKALNAGKTYCTEQIKKLLTKSLDICTELGTWATNFYIDAVIEKFCCRVEELQPSINAVDDNEKEYLTMLLLSIRRPIRPSLKLDSGLHLSGKVQCLIDFLGDLDPTDVTGLIFVKTRATCAVLAHLLTIHVEMRDRFRVSTFVGMSMSSSKKLDIGELVDVRDQKDTLDHLRSGKKNLVITTSALEEGIDVSACNVVICFEKPPNVKSFIQRRGRARKSESIYVLMFPEDDHLSKVVTWQQLEEIMKQTYMDDMRQLKEIEELEEAEEGHKEFKVESTG